MKLLNKLHNLKYNLKTFIATTGDLVNPLLHRVVSVVAGAEVDDRRTGSPVSCGRPSLVALKGLALREST
jgi:hypothetical protein